MGSHVGKGGPKTLPSPAPRGETQPREGGRREDEDREILERLKGGDARAFDELVLKYQDRLYNLAYRLLGDEQEAKDMTQEAFIRVYTHVGTFRGDASLLSWLYTILRNLSKNKLREWSRHHRAKTDSLDGASERFAAGEDGSAPRELAEPGLNALEQLEKREQDALVHRALHAIDPDYRMVVLLFDFEGMNYEAIAKVCDCPIGTVRSRLHRGRAMVKAKLEGWVPPPQSFGDKEAPEARVK